MSTYGEILIDGKKIAKEIEDELQVRVAHMTIPPKLSVVQVGEDPASTSYIRAKSNAADRIGISLTHHHLSSDIHSLKATHKILLLVV